MGVEQNKWFKITEAFLWYQEKKDDLSRDKEGLNIFRYRSEMIRYFERLYGSKIVFVVLISNTRKHAFLHIT